MPTSKTVNLKLWRQNFERVAAVQGEDKARVLSMVISEREGVPFDMSGYTAEIYMHEANGRDVTLPAEIDGNIVTAVIPLITAAGDAAIQVILTKSTGEILKVAGIVLDVQPSELENAVDGSDEFNLLVGVTKQAEKAAGDALEAADIALEAADSVKARADSGEFNGEKGDTGPQGPQGVSGVYVGDGDMPEGYSVQVDPTGDMLCYTAGESDDRYANVLTGTASGPVAALEDVSPTGALRRAAVLGATAETGSGDKGPDNPYTLAGVQPTKVTVCGRNLAANPRFNAVDQFSPCVYADCELQPNTKYTISLYVPAGEAYYTNENLFAKIVYLPVSTGGIYSAEATTKPTISNTDPKQYATGKGWTLLKTQSGTTASGNARDLQIEFGDTATPYEPYTGQTITLPALASLYGDGTVCDEYDVVSGVETRRWKRVVFDGTENWGLSRTESGNNRYFIRVPDAVAYNLLSQIVCSHWPSIGPGQTWQDKTGITLSLGNADKNIWIYDPRFAQADLPTFKAWLAAQYAAGTPVTVVYQLDAPAVTQHDPARILPPAPVCRVFADAGGVDVGYNRDINIAFEQQQAEYIAQIKALDARIAKLETGQPAEPMT